MKKSLVSVSVNQAYLPALIATETVFWRRLCKESCREGVGLFVFFGLHALHALHALAVSS